MSRSLTSETFVPSPAVSALPAKLFGGELNKTGVDVTVNSPLTKWSVLGALAGLSLGASACSVLPAASEYLSQPPEVLFVDLFKVMTAAETLVPTLGTSVLFGIINAMGDYGMLHSQFKKANQLLDFAANSQENSLSPAQLKYYENIAGLFLAGVPVEFTIPIFNHPVKWATPDIPKLKVVGDVLKEFGEAAFATFVFLQVIFPSAKNFTLQALAELKSGDQLAATLELLKASAITWLGFGAGWEAIKKQKIHLAD